MPNQLNYRTDLRTKTDPRYTVSRIISTQDNTILNEEVPASFAFDKDDNIEMHFYTLVSNELLLSVITRIDEGIIKSHIVSYSDGSYKNYIRVDFTKLFEDKEIILIPGDYRMVLNFFSNEIGSYDDRILNLDIISDSRTEVQLSFNNVIDNISLAADAYLLKEFVEKAFNKADAVGIAEKIFVSGIELNDDLEGVTANNVTDNIEIPPINQTRENTIDRMDRIGLLETFQQQLNSFIPELYKFIREEIVINGDDRIQESEFKELIQLVIRGKIHQFISLVDSRIQVS
jgi:hypothetical protein